MKNVLLKYISLASGMADCFIRDDCSIRVYRSVNYIYKGAKKCQAIAELGGAVPPALQSFRFIPKISIV